MTTTTDTPTKRRHPGRGRNKARAAPDFIAFDECRESGSRSACGEYLHCYCCKSFSLTLEICFAKSPDT